jgi:hypothetical protein
MENFVSNRDDGAGRFRGPAALADDGEDRSGDLAGRGAGHDRRRCSAEPASSRSLILLRSERSRSIPRADMRGIFLTSFPETALSRPRERWNPLSLEETGSGSHRIFPSGRRQCGTRGGLGPEALSPPAGRRGRGPSGRLSGLSLVHGVRRPFLVHFSLGRAQPVGQPPFIGPPRMRVRGLSVRSIPPARRLA